MSSTASPVGRNAPLPPLPSMSSNPVFAPKEAESLGATSVGLTSSHTPNPLSGHSRAAQVVSPSTSAYTHRALSPMSENGYLSAGASDGTGGIETRLGGPGGGTMAQSQSQASAAVTEWEMAYERGQEEQWANKVRDDLRGWRGGHGVKRSVYSRQALPEQSYFHQPKTGDIDHHLPKEVIRIERDWSDGEVCQFETSFPMELEDRISPADFTTFINTLNTHLIAAYSVKGAVVDNLVAIATWWTSLLWRTSTFERELLKVESEIREANEKLFNPAGLNVLTPRDVALQFLEQKKSAAVRWGHCISSRAWTPILFIYDDSDITQKGRPSVGEHLLQLYGKASEYVSSLSATNTGFYLVPASCVATILNDTVITSPLVRWVGLASVMTVAQGLEFYTGSPDCNSNLTATQRNELSAEYWTRRYRGLAALVASSAAGAAMGVDQLQAIPAAAVLSAVTAHMPSKEDLARVADSLVT